MNQSVETKVVSSPKLLLVDDHPVVREGLAFLLRENGFANVESTDTVQRALASIRHEEPALAVVDLMLNQHSGLDFIKQLSLEWPKLPILVLSMHDEALYADRCMRAGARGYVMKSEGHEVVVNAVRQVLSGKHYASEAVRDRALSRLTQKTVQTGSPEEALSDRELEVYTLIGQGRTTNEISKALSLSPKTVQTYRNHIKTKLGIATATGLVQRAVQWSTERKSLPTGF